MMLGLFGILVGDIQIDMIAAGSLHLRINSSRHYVARGKRQTRIILLHELLAIKIAKHSAVAAHRLGD